MADHTDNLPPDVLVIDDELGTRESIRFILQPDYAVLAAESVEAGLKVLRQRPVDAIILDLVLPGMSGIEGLREIRRLDPDVAVIILTAYASLETAQQAIRFGANDYQSKPFETAEIRHAVAGNISLTRAMRQRRQMVNELQEINQLFATEIHSQERLAYLGQLTAGIIKDLAGSAHGTRICLQLLRREITELPDLSQDSQDRLLRRLDDAEHSLAGFRAVAASLRDIYQTPSGQLHPVDLGRVLQDVLVILRPAFVARNCQVQVHLGAEKAMLVGDRLQLFQAFYHLINNAVEAVDPGKGRIDISCAGEGSQLTVTISDNGCGIPVPLLDRIFDQFFTTKDNASGLGLFAARSMIQAAGGSISVESQVGAGTKCTVCLPRRSAECRPTDDGR